MSRCSRRAEMANPGLSVQGTPAQGQDGHIPEPGLAQGLAEQRRVVGRPAGAAGLRQHEGRALGIAPSALQGVDKLPDDHDGGVAGVVVHVVEPGFDGLAADRGQDFQIVARAGNGPCR